jgi:beta-phosphoglucomutase
MMDAEHPMPSPILTKRSPHLADPTHCGGISTTTHDRVVDRSSGTRTLSEPDDDARVKCANLENWGTTLQPLQHDAEPHDAPRALGVIFDVDGVLIDSYEAHFQSWLALARETAAHFTRDAFTRTFGRTSREIIRECWPPEVVARHGVETLDARKEAIYRELTRNNVPIMPGAADLIDALASAGFRLALGSSGPPENVEMVLRTLKRKHLLAAVVTGKDVTRGKPDPQVFLIAAERLEIMATQCAVIEDAPAGIEAARAAGMPSIGLVSTGRTRDELRAADLVVHSLHELSPTVIQTLIRER